MTFLTRHFSNKTHKSNFNCNKSKTYCSPLKVSKHIKKKLYFKKAYQSMKALPQHVAE